MMSRGEELGSSSSALGRLGFLLTTTSIRVLSCVKLEVSTIMVRRINTLHLYRLSLANWTEAFVTL
jgi:hypothetical protein